MPGAGELRHRITITKPRVIGQTSFGEDAIEHEEVGTFSARIESLTGRELYLAQQRWAEARYRITMRYQPGVSLRREYTIEWNGQTLDILDIADRDNRRQWLELTCKDHVA